MVVEKGGREWKRVDTEEERLSEVEKWMGRDGLGSSRLEKEEEWGRGTSVVMKMKPKV